MKIHDLKLSKNVAIQTAPQIRLIQSNDKMPADKIQMAALSTVPLWESQIKIALGLAPAGGPRCPPECGSGPPEDRAAA